MQLPDSPRLAAGWLASGLLDRLGLLLLGRVRAGGARPTFSAASSRCIDSLLSERVSNASSVRLMEHAATLDLEDFEDAEFQDQLERARRQTSGRMTLMSQLFGQAQDIVTVVELRRRPDLLCAVADRPAAASRWCRPSSARRISTRRAIRSPIARTPGAARARLPAPDGGQRRDGQGSEDLRPQRLPDRPLSAACRRLLRGQPQARACGAPAGAALFTAHRHGRLLSRLCLHRLAHAGRRVLDRRPDVPRRLVPPACATSRRAAVGLLHDGRPGALPRRPVLLLRGRSRKSVRRRTPLPFPAPDPRRLRLRECRLHLSRRRAVGGAQSQLHAEGRRGAGAGRRERRRQDDPGEAAGPALRSRRRPHPARRPRPARLRPRRAARQYRRHLPGFRPLQFHAPPTISRSAGSTRATTARASRRPPSAAWPTR